MVNKKFEEFMQLCHQEIFEKQKQLTEAYQIELGRLKQCVMDAELSESLKGE